MTLRPTLPEKKRNQAWSTAFRLKACGYGNDPDQWHTDIPTFGRVHYESVGEGMDMVYRSAVISAQPRWPRRLLPPARTDRFGQQQPMRGGVHLNYVIYASHRLRTLFCENNKRHRGEKNETTDIFPNGFR
jgi:hypothetical protein